MLSLSQTFYAPLLTMLNAQELNGIFANIEEILLCNTVQKFPREVEQDKF